MKQPVSNHKATRQTEPAVQQHWSAGENAVALTPPAYGIEFADRAMPRRLEQSSGVGINTDRGLEGEAGDSSYIVAQRRQLHSMFGEVAQLRGGPEEDELVKGTPAAQRKGPEDGLLQGRFASIQRKEPENETGLPDHLKTGIESLSGMSMDGVTVHYNSSRPAKLQALAYAQGTDIHVAPGQERHLPHEAWHVVQQSQGRVRPTMQMKDGAPVNDDPGLEREADVMGEKAMARGTTPSRPMAVERMDISQTAASAAQLRAKFVEGAARRHYSDGWGAAYRIQDDSVLKDEVQNDELGNWTRRLGDYYNPTENKNRPCTVGYNNRQGRREVLTSIYHCGPSSQ